MRIRNPPYLRSGGRPAEHVGTTVYKNKMKSKHYVSILLILPLVCLIFSCSGTQSGDASKGEQLKVKDDFIQIKRNMWDRQYNIVLATKAKDISQLQFCI